ncbi:hypothetical protein PENTCL1PPCAC_4740, partial [Pristionchus entomophagus]
LASEFAFSFWFSTILNACYKHITKAQREYYSDNSRNFCGFISVKAGAQIISAVIFLRAVESLWRIIFPLYETGDVAATASIDTLDLVSCVLVFVASHQRKEELLKPILSFSAIKLLLTILTMLLCVIGLVKSHS